MNKMSKEFTQRRVTDSVASGYLDPDTNKYIDTEQTRWWNNLEDNTIISRVRMNKEDETTNHLSPNSQLDSTNSDGEWWKHLEHVNSENNTSTNSRFKKRFSAVIEKLNIMEESTSESEKETNMKRRKVLRIITSKRSKSNRFSNILTQDSSISLPVLTPNKKANVQLTSSLNNDVSDREISQTRSRENKEDSLTHTGCTLNSDVPRGLREKEANIFQNSKLKGNFIHSEVKRTSNKSTSRKTIQNSGDESDISNKILKPKSKFLRSLRSSIRWDVFDDTVSNNNSESLSQQKNPNKISTDNVESQTLSRQSSKSSRESVNRSNEINKSKSNVNENTTAQDLLTHRNSKTRSLNIFKETTLSDISITDNMRPFVKSKTLIARRHESSLDESNAFREVDIRSAMSPEKHISIERNEATRRITRARVSLLEKNSQSDWSTSEQGADDFFHTQPSLIEKNGSEKQVADILINDNNKRDVKTFSQKSKIAELSKKRILSHPARENISKASQENTATSEKPQTNERSDSETELIDVVGDDVHDSMISRLNLSTTVKPSSKLSPRKEIYSLRSNLRNQSETSNKSVEGLPRRSVRKSYFKEADNKKDIESENDTSNIPRTRSSTRTLRNKSETPKKVAKLPRRSARKSYFEEAANAKITDSEKDKNIARTRKSINNLKNTLDERASVTKTSIERHEPGETVTVDIEDASLTVQTIQENSFLTSNEMRNRQTMSRTLITRNSPDVNRNKEILQRSGLRTQISHGTPIQVSSNKDKEYRKMEDFFKLKPTSTTTSKQSTLSDHQLSTKKFEKVKEALEKLKKREMAAMKMNVVTNRKVTKSVNTIFEQSTRKQKQPSAGPAKIVSKAFLVNGKVYRPPKLPRPLPWVTDRLYKYLWKCMEPKYKLSTRVRSEKFIVNLAEVVSLVEKHKNYDNYRVELTALMKEMARLQVIKTCNDFYIFCQEFLPYEFRIRAIPMLMPGNKMNIPFNSSTLHAPLLDT